jgi:hypothetical protein
VTAALEAGDPALAQAEAAELLAAVQAALASGEVPRALAAEVRRGAERLASLVDAAQRALPPAAPEPPPEGDDEDDDGPGKGKGKGKDKDNGKDEKDEDD